MADRSYSIPTINLPKYLGSLIKGDDSPLYFAIGVGNSEWDSGELPNPSPNIGSLVNETYRVVIDKTLIEYVDPSNYSIVVSAVSNVVRLEINLQYSDYQGMIREYGIFGIDATESIGSGTLLQYSDFDVQTIPADTGIKFWVYLTL